MGDTHGESIVSVEKKSMEALSFNGLGEGMESSVNVQISAESSIEKVKSSSQNDSVSSTAMESSNGIEGGATNSRLEPEMNSAEVSKSEKPSDEIRSEQCGQNYSSASCMDNTELGAVPKPHLSWGDVTQIPDEDASGGRPYDKHSVDNAWKIKCTQNPSKPLVRRPTPMAISVPKSILEKGKKPTIGSFDEGEEEEEEGDSQVPVSLKNRISTEVMVIEDVVEEEEVEDDVKDGKEERNVSKGGMEQRIEGEGDESRIGLQKPNDLPLASEPASAVLQIGKSDLGAGSPTIVVRTDIGTNLPVDETKDFGNSDGNEDSSENSKERGSGEAEAASASAPGEQFLSPNNTELYEKRLAAQPIPNSHAQTSPNQKRKLVRRETPISLDIPQNLKVLGARKNSSEADIFEEEDDEEEEKDDEKRREEKNEAVQEPTTSIPEIAEEEEVENNNVKSRPDILDSVNCNNNHHESASLDLVDGVDTGARVSANVLESDNGKQQLLNVEKKPEAHRSEHQGLFRKAASFDEKHSKPYMAARAGGVLGGKGRDNLFRKSASCDKSDDKTSPLSARRKVSKHHRKILTRKATPLQIDVPPNILSDSMTAKKQMSFDEANEEEK